MREANQILKFSDTDIRAVQRRFEGPETCDNCVVLL